MRLFREIGGFIMQKLTKSRGEHLKPVKLFLDDIERIVATLREVSSEVEITTDEYVLADLSQLSDLKHECLTTLKLLNRNPYLAVDLEPSRVWLYIAEDTPTARGLYEKVRSILVQQRRPFASALISWWFPLMISAGMVTAFLIGTIQSNPLAVGLGLVLFGFALWGMWYSHRVVTGRYSIIIPKRRRESPSFLKRNADRIILAMISAIAGGIITSLLSSLISQFIGPSR
ncbi:MAG: hypothetical protein HY645_15195 [Acidobacteria bacterium]|nr:hypothetical protein [Acidobacteriota bacterium]